MSADLMLGDFNVSELARMAEQLQQVDYTAIGSGDLHGGTVGLFAVLDQLHAGAADAAARWADRGDWSDDGSRSPTHRLARDTGLAPKTTGRMIRLGRGVDHMPSTQAAWHAGRLSIDVVGLLVAVRDGREELFARDEAVLVSSLAGLRYRQAEQVIAHWKHRADDELHPDGPPPVVDPDVTVATTFDGATYLTGVLDPIGGATLTEALNRIEHELYVADRNAGRDRRRGERRAAALVEMAVRATSTPPGSTRPEPLVIVLAGEESLARVCELSNGRVIAPATIVPHLDHAVLQTIVFDGADRPIRGSHRRCFTGLLKRAIQARDRHCQHPSGCDEPINHCDIDHITPHAAGGPTELDNGQLQCTTHNRNAYLHGRSPRPPDEYDDLDDDFDDGLDDPADPLEDDDDGGMGDRLDGFD